MKESEIGEITGGWDLGDLPANVVVGSDCFIERRDSLEHFRSEQEHGLILGDGVKIFTLTDLNVEPSGSISIGANSIIAGATFMCAERIEIGRDVVVSYKVTIADSDFHPRDPEARRQDAVANSPRGDRSQRPPIETKPVVIEDGARLGIGAIILKGVRVGAGAVIEAGAVVTKDVPAGATATGNPAVVDAG